MLFVGSFSVENGPEHRAEGLCCVPKYEKAVVCLTEKIWVLDTLHSGVSYSTVGCAFHVHQSMIYIK